MTADEFYEYAKNHGHQIDFLDLEECQAMSVEINGECFIGLSTSTPASREKELIAHELGHCEYAGFYNQATPLNTRARIEYRARKWQFCHLVPLGELREAIRKGITTPWDLAEYFDVSEEVIVEACAYYTSACGAIMDMDKSDNT